MPLMGRPDSIGQFEKGWPSQRSYSGQFNTFVRMNLFLLEQCVGLCDRLKGLTSGMFIPLDWRAAPLKAHKARADDV